MRNLIDDLIQMDVSQSFCFLLTMLDDPLFTIIRNYLGKSDSLK
jgi:hypothetical protein